MEQTIQEIMEKQKSFKNETPQIYLFFVLSFITLTLFISAFIILQGELFYGLCGMNIIDFQFSDFFNSLQYSVDSPYTYWKVSYPALITLIYGLLGWIITPYLGPDFFPWGPDFSHRAYTSYIGMTIFFFLTVFAIYLLYIQTFKLLSEKYNRKSVDIIFFLILFSMPFMYAMVRGNNIVYTIFFMILFLLGYNSENKIVRLFSYIALGIATGIKVLPAIFALLILKNRKYTEFLYCIIIVSQLFFLPFLLTDGTPMILFDTVLNNKDVTCGGWIGVQQWFVRQNEELGVPIQQMGVPFSLAMMILGALIVAFDTKLEYWKSVTILGIIMQIGIAYNSPYSYLYFLPGFLLFLRQYEKDNKEHFYVLLLFVVIFVAVNPIEFSKSFSAFVILLIIFKESILRFINDSTIKLRIKNN